jgi:hypothetical protein
VNDLLPGDLLVFDDGSRTTVRHAEQRVRTRTASCGCCSTEEDEYLVWVDDDWTGPVEVITKGGGTVHVMPLRQQDWPDDTISVLRDGGN